MIFSRCLDIISNSHTQAHTSSVLMHCDGQPYSRKKYSIPFDSIYGTTAPSGPWPPSEDTSTSSISYAHLLHPCIHGICDMSLQTMSSHLVLDFPTALVLRNFPLRTFFGIISSSSLITWPANSILLILISSVILRYLYKLKVSVFHLGCQHLCSCIGPLILNISLSVICVRVQVTVPLHSTGFINVSCHFILLFLCICLYLYVACREEWAVLAAIILALISSVSSLVLLFTVPKHLVLLTASMSWSVTANVSLILLVLLFCTTFFSVKTLFLAQDISWTLQISSDCLLGPLYDCTLLFVLSDSALCFAFRVTWVVRFVRMCILSLRNFSEWQIW